MGDLQGFADPVEYVIFEADLYEAAVQYPI
jgi:hypothetical protein